MNKYKLRQETCRKLVRKKFNLSEKIGRLTVARKIGWHKTNGMPPDNKNQCPSWRKLAEIIGITGTRDEQ